MSEPTAKEILAEIDRTIEAMAALANSGLPEASMHETRSKLYAGKRALLGLADWIKARTKP